MFGAFIFPCRPYTGRPEMCFLILTELLFLQPVISMPSCSYEDVVATAVGMGSTHGDRPGGGGVAYDGAGWV